MPGEEKEIPVEVLKTIDEHLLYNMCLVSHTVSFADIFLLSMLKRGEMGVTSGAEL